MRAGVGIFLALFLSSLSTAFAAPSLTGIHPSSALQGATLNLIISGTGFVNAGTELRFPGGGIIVNGVRVESPVSIVANITVVGAPGSRMLSVSSNGESNALPFTVLPGALSNPVDAVVTQFTGSSGGPGVRDGTGTEARFYHPLGVWSDGAALYVADRSAHTIRKVSIATGEVTTLAGEPQQAGYVNGRGREARFNSPDRLWGDGQYLYVRQECTIRRITIAGGDVSTLAGVRNECATVDGPASEARLRGSGPIIGDGAFLYVLTEAILPRFDPPTPPVVRVISLATGHVSSIPLPYIPNAANSPFTPTGMWLLNGYLYTTWPASATGAHAIGRTHPVTHAFERLSNFDLNPHTSPAAATFDAWSDGAGNIYYARLRDVYRASLLTGDVELVGMLPERSSTFGRLGVWGVGQELFIADEMESVVWKFHAPTGQAVALAGLQPGAPHPDASIPMLPVLGMWGNSAALYTVTDQVSKLDYATGTYAAFGSALREPHGIWGDAGYLYVADSGNKRIARIALTTGETTTLATGFAYPLGIWGDATYLYVTDGATIRRVAKSTGAAITFAGVDGQQGSVDGIGVQARFRSPQGIWGDGVYLYVADEVVRRIHLATAQATTLVDSLGSPLQGVSAVAGDGAHLYLGSRSSLRRFTPATGELSSFFSTPAPDALWSDGQSLFVNRRHIFRIPLSRPELVPVYPPLAFSEGVMPSSFKVDARSGDGEFLYGVSGSAVYRTRIATGEVRHLAGAFDDSGEQDAAGNRARFRNPGGMWGDGAFLYLTDAGGIRRIDLSTGEVTTPAQGFGLESTGHLWGDGRNLYISDLNRHAIFRMNLATREVTRFAGGPTVNEFADGAGLDARLRAPGALWGDGDHLYLIDSCAIRRVAIASAEVTTFAGAPDCSQHIDGHRDVARFRNITRIWGDGRRLFVTTYYSVRTIDLLTGEVATLAGSSVLLGVENGPATQARFLGNGWIWSDGAGLFVSDNGIRKISFASASHSFVVGPAAAEYWTTTGTDGAITIGYGRLQPGAGSSAVEGVAVISHRSNGVLISEAAVAATPPVLQGRIFARMDGSIRTGIALVNPGEQEVTVAFYFTDARGVSSGHGTTILAPHRQIAAFLNEAPFHGLPEARTFTFTASAPVGAAALRGRVNERNEFLITALPVAPIAAPSVDLIVLPHFAAGGGWRTEVLLVNPTDGVLTGAVLMDGTFTYYEIPARSATSISSASTGTVVRTGPVLIIPLTSAPVPSVVFSYASGGVTVTETAATTSGIASSFRIFAEFDAAQAVQTGFALFNPGDSAATVQLELFHLSGATAAPAASLALPPNGRRSMFLDEIAGFGNLPVKFRGVLRISSNAALWAMGFRTRYNERGEFLITAMPAIAETSSPSPNAELLFPHVVSGGGFATEFLLMGRGAAAGAVLFRNQTGSELPLPLAR